MIQSTAQGGFEPSENVITPKPGYKLYKFIAHQTQTSTAFRLKDVFPSLAFPSSTLMKLPSSMGRAAGLLGDAAPGSHRPGSHRAGSQIRDHTAPVGLVQDLRSFQKALWKTDHWSPPGATNTYSAARDWPTTAALETRGVQNRANCRYTAYLRPHF